MKNLLYFLLTVFLFSCGSIQVNHDYDKKTNFSNYKTYNYYSDISTGLSTLDTKRLFNVLDTALQAKGLTLSENPDFLINIKSSEFHSAQQNTVGVGVGGGGRHVGGGVSIGIPVGKSNINRELIIEFVDDNSIGLFWQAIAESQYNPNAKPEQREAHLKAVIDKALLEYPPKL